MEKETLSILVSLCEMGVNPEALANIVKELQTLKDGGDDGPEFS